MINALDPGTFVTLVLLTFALVLVIAGAFTAYFGSGKSRKIGGGLLVGGLGIGIVWVYLGAWGPLKGFAPIWEATIQGILVLVAAFIGAGAAIGLFLLAIMKS